MSCFRRLSGCTVKPFHRNKASKLVYVLKLQDNKYYVGESDDVRKRMWDHVNNRGSAWTRKHPVIRRVEPITSPTTHFWELSETLEQIKQHGIDNVRGSLFSKLKLDESDKKMALSLYCEKHKLCWNCGSDQHFVHACPGIHKELWTYNFTGTDSGRNCVVCGKQIDKINGVLNYCSEFCRDRHSV